MMMMEEKKIRRQMAAVGLSSPRPASVLLEMTTRRVASVPGLVSGELRPAGSVRWSSGSALAKCSCERRREERRFDDVRELPESGTWPEAAVIGRGGRPRYWRVGRGLGGPRLAADGNLRWR